MPIMRTVRIYTTNLPRSAALAAWFLLTAIVTMGTAVPRVFRLLTIIAPIQRPGTTTRADNRQPGSTASLFTYRRDDSPPDAVTRVNIDVRRTAATAIHQDIFGNFIEHLGGVVYPGLWAQVLLNPNLEAVEPLRLSVEKGGEALAPPHWNVNPLAHWRQGGKERHGYHSPGYVMLLPAAGADAEPGTLSQTVYLPAHRARTYAGSIAVRVLPEADTSPEKDPPQAHLRVAVRPERTGAGAVAETTIQATSSEWTLLPIRLTLRDGALPKGAASRFSIEHVGGAAVDVDRIELFPSDNVDGVDRDVLRKAQEWHIPVMRWPGGNFASGYHWQDGVGARSQRPTRRNSAWGGVESNEFGTDEFLAFCRRIGTQPQLTVNAGDGTPEEAAGWVRYCNAPADDRYGRMRRTLGHPDPYNVRLWEVGNELYGDWQIGHTVPEDNARRFVRFRNALHGADPGLRLIATGKADEFLRDGLARNSAWNEALLRAATAGGGRPPDYLSIHPLVPLPSSLRGLSYAEQYESAMAHPTFLDRVLIPDLWERIRAITGPRSLTRIAVTEWGLIVGGAGWENGPNHDTQAGAVYNALCLNAILRHSDQVTLANMTAFMHGGGIKKPGGAVIVDPQYYTQQLYAAADMHTPVAAETIGPGADVPERGFLPAVRDVPDVDVFSALDRSARKLVVCAVNRRQSQPRTIQIRIDGFRAAHVAATLLSAPAPTARNTISAPDAVAPRPVTVTSAAIGGRKTWRAVLPPHSVVVITLMRE